jgi:putative transposase
MPRKARLIVPGAVYHVMGRCLETCQMFSDDTDREGFLAILETCLNRTNTQCYAWVLMCNHYHLVLRLGAAELWEVMKPLNMRYAQYHSKKTGRRGPLFMDRYKSIVTQDQNYAQELVRYVHLNPVRAGICKNLHTLERYPWSGHSVLMGRIERKFQDTRSVLRRFGPTNAEARKTYCQYLRDGLEKGTEADTITNLIRKSNAGSEAGRKTTCWVIGDQKFVSEAMKHAQERKMRISRFEKEGGGFDRIAEKMQTVFKIPAEMLLIRQRGGVGSEARKAFAYIAAKTYNAPISKVAEYLGVGSAAVSAMVHSGRNIVNSRKIAI